MEKKDQQSLIKAELTREVQIIELDDSFLSDVVGGVIAGGNLVDGDKNCGCSGGDKNCGC